MATGKSVPRRTSHFIRGKTIGTSGFFGSPSLAERVQAEREQLFKVIGIVELCRFATATSLEVTDSEYMIPAFEAICDQLNTSAERLEWIASDLQKLPRKDKR